MGQPVSTYSIGLGIHCDVTSGMSVVPQYFYPMTVTYLFSETSVLDDGISPPQIPRALQYVGVYEKTVMGEIVRRKG
jgi:hypothetical protein